MERYEAESEKNNGEILQLTTKLSISDQMAIKANKYYNKKMKEENKKVVDTERKVSEQENKIIELERKIKSQDKEIRIWKRCSNIFGSKESINKYDPHAPEMIPDVKITAEISSDSCDQDSATSIEPISRDTTTAGIFGDTTAPNEEDSLVLPQERDPSPSSIVSVKRRKISERKHTREVSSRSSSSDSMRTTCSKEEKLKKTSKPKAIDGDMVDKVKTLEQQSIRDREEMENLRKQIENLRISLEEKDKEITVNMESKKENTENIETQTENMKSKIVHTENTETQTQTR